MQRGSMACGVALQPFLFGGEVGVEKGGKYDGVGERGDPDRAAAEERAGDRTENGSGKEEEDSAL